MREIRFRGKRLDGREWLYGDLIHRGKRAYIFPPDEVNSALYYEVDAGTVGQYTGVRDKHRIDIYEGDILSTGLYNPFESSGRSDNTYVVIYTECAFHGKNHTGSIPLWDLLNRCIVIGSVHNRGILEGCE